MALLTGKEGAIAVAGPEKHPAGIGLAEQSKAVKVEVAAKGVKFAVLDI